MSRSGILGVAFVLAAATPAWAHFHLDEPLAMTTQATNGDPQKVSPCGAADLVAFDSGDSNNAQTGSTITVTIHETVSHGGHYRVALAQDPASLPAEPPVSGANCGSAPIDPAPTFPILADGLFQTVTPATGPVSADVQLPAGMQCQNCVIQVLQFMTNHAPPCFYHHCARINIVDDPSTLPDAGPTPGAEAGVDPVGDDTGTAGGCCSANRGAPGALLLGLAVLGLVLRRRR